MIQEPWIGLLVCPGQGVELSFQPTLDDQPSGCTLPGMLYVLHLLVVVLHPLGVCPRCPGGSGGWQCPEILECALSWLSWSLLSSLVLDQLSHSSLWLVSWVSSWPLSLLPFPNWTLGFHVLHNQSLGGWNLGLLCDSPSLFFSQNPFPNLQCNPFVFSAHCTHFCYSLLYWHY